MKRKAVMRLMAVVLASSMIVPGIAGVPGFGETVLTVDAAESLHIEKVLENVKFDTASTWDELKDNSGAAATFNLTTKKAPEVGTKLQFDILLPAKEGETGENPSFEGAIKPGAVMRIGSNWTWVQSNTIPEFKAAAFTRVTIDGTDYFKATASIPFESKVGANDKDGTWNGSMDYSSVVDGPVVAMNAKIAGDSCTYTGNIILANATLVEPIKVEEKDATVISDFATGAQGWTGENGWDYSHGKDVEGTGQEKPDVAWDSAAQALKVSLDYSKNSASTWSEAKISNKFDQALDMTDYNQLTFDIEYPEDFNFKVKIFGKNSAGDTVIDTYTDIKKKYITDSDKKGYKKATAHISFSAVKGDLKELTIGLIGYETAFKGDVSLDNITLCQVSEADDYVKITSKVKSNGDAAKITGMTKTVSLANPNADNSAKALAAYLKNISGIDQADKATDNDQVLFGHQNSTFRSVNGKMSDVKDVTGSEAGIFGIDTLSLTGVEIGASNAKDAIAKSVAATKTAYQGGSIVTLSCHMPNFTNKKIKETTNADGTKSYDFTECDFSESKDCTNNCAEQILPGGAYNDRFNAYLDIIAEYALELQKDNIPVLFRPFHENTGGWFWWGTSTKTEVYRAMWRYTVDYLQAKGVNNFLYVYSPNGPLTSEEDYLTRYPGDDYVDVLAFDCYDDCKDGEEYTGTAFFENMDKTCKVISGLAKKKNKIAAIAESGVRVNESSLKASDNPVTGHDWYNRLLKVASDNDISYFLIWANFAKDNFFVPYKYNDELGQEMINEFIDFYNSENSIFGNGTNFYGSGALSNGKNITNTNKGEVSGYMVSPVDYTVIKSATTLKGSVKNADEVYFEIKSNPSAKGVKVAASYNDKTKLYEAKLDTATLQSLGQTELATISLYGKKNGAESVLISTSQFICLNKDKSVMPAQIFDNFEYYYGNNDLFQNAYGTHNSAGGCSSSISLDKNNKASGDYGAAFKYTLAYSGSEVWTGGLGRNFTTTDFSKYNAVSMWVKPDGNGQKLVVQLKDKDGAEYEAYLTNFGKTTEARYVTIPFSSFKKKGDNSVTINDEKQIAGYALWCNSIPDNYKGKKNDDGSYTVSGTVVFDDIQAVKISNEDLAKTDKDGLIITKAALNDLSNGQVTPTTQPTAAPTTAPTTQPTAAPTTAPTAQPTAAPTTAPTTQPTVAPTTQPTAVPGESQISNPGVLPTQPTETQTPVLAKNEKVKVGNATYQVTSTKGTNTVKYIAANKKTTKVSIPSKVTINGTTYKVTAVASNAFKNNKFVKEVKVPNTVKSIGANAFSGCTKLTKVTLPNTVKTIGTGAFSGCTKLTKVTLPKSVTTIGANAFKNSKNLKTITIQANSIKTIRKNAFKDINKNAVIQVKTTGKTAQKQKKAVVKQIKASGIAKTVKVK